MQQPRHITNIRTLPLTLLLALILTLTSLTTLKAAEPILPKAQGDACVEPTEIMRKQHMNFLLHQRDKTVYQGIRTKQHSLKQCIDCHVQTDDNNQPIPINAEGQFCQSCHAFASVKMDCFECHATTPDQIHTTNNSTSLNKTTPFHQYRLAIEHLTQ